MSSLASRPNGPVNDGQKLPDRFRCGLGGEWKPFSGFSKRQQKLVTDKLGRRVRIDAANTGMICRIHSGEPVKEIRCEGPCDMIRILEEFSKNNRVNGNYICKQCQHWTNTQEPGYAPWAAPEAQLDPLEHEDARNTNHLPTEPSDIFDFGSDIPRPLAPVTGADVLSTVGSGEPGGPSLRDSDINSIRPAVRRNDSSRLGTGSIDSSRLASGSVVSDDTNMSRLGELSGPMAGMWLSNASVAQQHTSSIKYNAWDSEGRKHAMNKTPTVQSGKASTMMDSLASGSNMREVGSNNRNEGRVGHGAFIQETVTRTTQTRTTQTHGFGSAPERQGDRKQLTEKEHRDRQKSLLPNRQAIMPDLEDGFDDDDSE
ncbi:stc1 domain protein [Colletotrichum musicola]|uniref:Stc1 domain protein n=1 Tax=Colletotrichum musicola TaxID=2175873 RepID=A0A8H6NY92_9PEZI|nr:stc1 domain protein [Colletotrichum musicola]